MRIILLCLTLILFPRLSAQENGAPNSPYQSFSELDDEENQTEKPNSPYESFQEIPNDNDGSPD